MHSNAIATVSSGLVELSLAPGSIKSHKQSDLNFCPFCADARFALLSCERVLQEGAFPNLFDASFNMCTREREEREERDGSRAL